MSKSTSKVGSEHTWHMRLLLFLSMFCLIFTAVAVVNTVSVHAASKVKVTKVQFSPKEFDVTLGKDSEIKLTLTLNKLIKNGRHCEVTLQNGKKKIKLAKQVTPSKKLSFKFTVAPDPDQNIYAEDFTKGKWKVTKVVLRDMKYGKEVTLPGYWDWRWPWRYWPPRKVKPLLPSKKALATITVKNKTTFQLYDGDPVVLTNTALPQTVRATDNVTLSATLKCKNKPIANEYVYFYLFNEKASVNHERWQSDAFGVGSAKTDANGVAKFTVPSNIIATKVGRNHDNEYFMSYTAVFKGTAKKYKTGTSSSKGTEILRDKINITVNPGDIGWDGHSGTHTYKAKVANARTGAGVPGVALLFKLQGKQSGSRYATATTNSSGIATATINYPADEWNLYDDNKFSVYFGEKFDTPYYIIGNFYEYNQVLESVQSVKNYTLDSTKIALLDNSGGPWGKAGASSAGYLTVSAENALIIDGKPLDILSSSQNPIGRFAVYFNGSSSATKEGTLTYKNGVVSGTVSGISGFSGLNTMRVVITLDNFELKTSSAEYTYQPTSGLNPVIIPNYTWK